MGGGSVKLEVPRTRTQNIGSDPGSTFSSQASLPSWEGESNLKLGIAEVGGGGSEMEEAGVQRGLGMGKEMYEMVKL